MGVVVLSFPTPFADSGRALDKQDALSGTEFRE